ncbi:ABC transporter G family member 31-like [Hibiscus syriacus]|uniref:ABC transporter G family member 31-like n=1 Tax=Hibiscus syriacus TaxID=106335 RepID=UPI001922D32C|nr:ABC transporter G family member 31-like [Hibiscus syriacus]
MMFNGFSELPLMIIRLPLFYKHRDNLFHHPWIWLVVSFILSVPYSVVEAIVWSCVVYYTIGFTPSPGRFFRFMFVKFVVHQMAIGLFRMLDAIARDIVIANTFGSAAILIVLLLGGFLVPKDEIKPWWTWASWLSPLQYAQRAVSVNEFTTIRWKKISFTGNGSVGDNVLHAHGLPTDEYLYWLGVGVLVFYAVLFNVVVTLALIYLNRELYILLLMV